MTALSGRRRLMYTFPVMPTGIQGVHAVFSPILGTSKVAATAAAAVCVNDDERAGMIGRDDYPAAAVMMMVVGSKVKFHPGGLESPWKVSTE